MGEMPAFRPGGDKYPRMGNHDFHGFHGFMGNPFAGGNLVNGAKVITHTIKVVVHVVLTTRGDVLKCT